MPLPEDDPRQRQPDIGLAKAQPVEMDGKALTQQHGYHLGQRQAHYVGVGPDDFLHETAGEPLDGIATRLAAPLA